MPATVNSLKKRGWESHLAVMLCSPHCIMHRMFKLWLSRLAANSPHKLCFGADGIVRLLGSFETYQGSVWSLTVQLLCCPCKLSTSLPKPQQTCDFCRTMASLLCTKNSFAHVATAVACHLQPAARMHHVCIATGRRQLATIWGVLLHG